MPTAKPAPIEPPALPEDPARYRRGNGGPRFWLLLLLIFGWTAICVIGGAVLVSLAPKSNDAAQLTLPFTRPAQTPAEPVVAARPAEPLPEGSGVEARIARLEAAQRQTSETTAAILAAASLAEAAEGPAPFSQEVATVGRFLPASTDVAALQRIAQAGAPTRTALATEFSRVATRAAVAARTPSKDEGLLARASHAFSNVITIRRLDETGGDGADAVIARAEMLIEEGDIEGGVAELDRLSPAGRNALAAWRAKAARRIEIDRLVSQIRAAALADLARGAEAGS